jgi:hypothetical protein
MFTEHSGEAVGTHITESEWLNQPGKLFETHIGCTAAFMMAMGGHFCSLWY